MLVADGQCRAIAAHFRFTFGLSFVEYFGLAADRVAGIDGPEPTDLVDAWRPETGDFVLIHIVDHHAHRHRARMPAAGRKFSKIRLRRSFVIQVERLRIKFGGKLDHLLARHMTIAKRLLGSHLDILEIDHRCILNGG